jgi:hypothetical protein
MEEAVTATIEAAVVVEMVAMVAEMAEVDVTNRKGSGSGRDGSSGIAQGTLVHK